MKKSLVIMTAAALVAIGCERGEIREGAGAERDRIDQMEDTQRDQLDAQQEQIEQEARAQQESIDAQVEAEKAQIEAQKKQLEAEADAQRAQAESQEEIEEAAGAARTDDQLEQQVQQAIFGDTQPGAANQNVLITVQDGKVTLTGIVGSDEEKKMYEDAAKNVPGVKSVDNNLRVQD